MTEGPKVADGIIEAALPKALFRVRLDFGRTVTASISLKAKNTTVKFIPGDRVSVELSPYDPTRGRIITRT